MPTTEDILSASPAPTGLESLAQGRRCSRQLNWSVEACQDPALLTTICFQAETSRRFGKNRRYDLCMADLMPRGVAAFGSWAFDEGSFFKAISLLFRSHHLVKLVVNVPRTHLQITDHVAFSNAVKHLYHYHAWFRQSWDAAGLVEPI